MQASGVDGFNILMTFVTEINPIGFLSLCKKIMLRFLIFAFAERAE
jgi:hypothetical protein